MVVLISVNIFSDLTTSKMRVYANGVEGRTDANIRVKPRERNTDEKKTGNYTLNFILL